MRILIEWEMSGNQFLELIRKTPKAIARELFRSASVHQSRSWEEHETFNKSVNQLIESKKR